MAIYQCPECGKKVSDQAARCPHCGLPQEYVIEYISKCQSTSIEENIDNRNDSFDNNQKIIIKNTNNVVTKNKSKRIALYAFIVMALLCCIAYGGYYLCNVNKEKDIIPFAQNGRWGFMDTDGNIIVQIRYNYVGEFSDGLAAVRQGDKWGYIDETGEEVIPIQFIGEPHERGEVGKFVNGTALVGLDNRKWGVINKQGTIINPIKDVDTYYDEIDIMNNGYLHINRYIQGKGDEYMLINNVGDIVVPRGKYKEINVYDDVIVVRNGQRKYGLLTHDGTEIVPCEYDHIGSFNEGYAQIELDDRYGYINKEGVEIISCLYDNASNFNNGLAAVQLNGKWGLINSSGEIAIQCYYDKILHANFNEYIAVCLNDKWGYINHKGKEIIPCIYEQASVFSDGIACVKHNGVYKLINKRGDVVSTFMSDDESSITYELIFGKVILKRWKDSYGEYQSSLISPDGLVIKSSDDMYKLGEYYFEECKDGKLLKIQSYFEDEIIYIDRKGNEIVPQHKI